LIGKDEQSAFVSGSIDMPELDSLLGQETDHDLVAQVVGVRADSDDVVRGRDHSILVMLKVVNIDVVPRIIDAKHVFGIYFDHFEVTLILVAEKIIIYHTIINKILAIK
jgi:hypothetical protein